MASRPFVLFVTLTLAACPTPPQSGDATNREVDVFDDRDSEVIPAGDELSSSVANEVDADVTCTRDEDCRGSDPCVVGTCVESRCELSARVCPADANPCTDSSCRPGIGCDDVPNIALCDDLSACTGNDRCNGGACAGQPVTCDDEEPCTTDSCDPDDGCVFTAREAACDDGNACTVGDLCVNGRCGAGEPIECPLPPNTSGCSLATCDTRLGCGIEAVSGPCDDGDLCTSDDTCDGGACVGALVRCDDQDPCTDDYCAPGAGCKSTNNRAPCDDGDACTTGDRCDGGECVPGARSDTCCDCVDDLNACTIDVCTASGCEPAPSPLVPTIADGGLLFEDFEAELDPARWTLVSDNPEVTWQRDASWRDQGQWSLYLGKVPAYSYDFGATRASATWRGPLPRDASELVVFVRAQVAETSCSYDALTVTLDGVPLARNVCGASEAQWRWDVSVKAGRVVSIGFVFDTVDGDDNDGAGVWLDTMRFARTTDSQCCETVEDCAAPEPCQQVLCAEHRCVATPTVCP